MGDSDTTTPGRAPVPSSSVYAALQSLEEDSTITLPAYPVCDSPWTPSSLPACSSPWTPYGSRYPSIMPPIPLQDDLFGTPPLPNTVNAEDWPLVSPPEPRPTTPSPIKRLEQLTMEVGSEQDIQMLWNDLEEMSVLPSRPPPLSELAPLNLPEPFPPTTSSEEKEDIGALGGGGAGGEGEEDPFLPPLSWEIGNSLELLLSPSSSLPNESSALNTPLAHK